MVDGWWLVGDLVPGQSAILKVGRPVGSELNMTSFATGFLRSFDPNLLKNQPYLTINTQKRLKATQKELDTYNVPKIVDVQAQTNNDEKTVPMQNTGTPLNLPSLALLLTFLAAILTVMMGPKQGTRIITGYRYYFPVLWCGDAADNTLQ